MRLVIFLTLISLAGIGGAQATPTTETIIMIRHGEKPEQGLGQLNCRGLNRSLKLPAVIEEKFGKPDVIFAPDPAGLKKDRGVQYPYNRPLSTVEPMAIKLGIPVDIRFGYKDIDQLQDALERSEYKASTVLVAWKHKQIVKLARNILKEEGGDEASVLKWNGNDFDSIYVVRITRDGSKTTAQFEHLNQGLNNQSDLCPS